VEADGTDPGEAPNGLEGGVGACSSAQAEGALGAAVTRPPTKFHEVVRGDRPAGDPSRMLRTTLLVFAALLSRAPAQAANIDWHDDLAAATTLAAERHAGLFVVFRCER